MVSDYPFCIFIILLQIEHTPSQMEKTEIISKLLFQSKISFRSEIFALNRFCQPILSKDCRGCGRMYVEFQTTDAISAYHR
jgi:hypothetical protein